jgi:hypothetical protein
MMKMTMTKSIVKTAPAIMMALLWLDGAHAAPNDKTQKHRGMARLQELMKSEPSIRDTQKAALKYYQLEPERIRALTTAAQVKGLLPEVDAGLDSTVGHTYNETQDALFPMFPYKDRDAGSSDQMVWHVRGVWDLSRLAFNPEQLDIKTLNSLQETLVREVTTLYFQRRRVMASLLLSPPQDEEELFDAQLRLQELTATIDAFTGGKFAPNAWNGDLGQ